MAPPSIPILQPYHSSPLQIAMAMEELSSLFCYQESTEELKQKLLYMTYELQSARIQVEEEARKSKEAMESTKQLLNLLHVAYKERDEAKHQLRKLLLSPESPLFKSSSGVTESNSHSADSLYDVVSPLAGAESAFVHKKQIDPESEIIYRIAQGRPLPKKGKLLEAVVGSGPLLQTLMVAGPMPRWRNPPPLQPLRALPTSGPRVGKRPLNTNSVVSFAGGMCYDDGGVGFGSETAKRHRIQ